MQILAIDPDGVETLRAGLKRMQAADGATPGRGLESVGGRVAVVPLVGPIIPNGGFFAELFGLAALDVFRARFKKAMGDPNVGAVVLKIDSPGGMITGVPETAEEVFKARGKGKQIVSVADGMAASAAFWIGAASDRFYAGKSARVGSVGVIATHWDVSEALRKKGIKPTTITSAPFKGEGAAEHPLTEEAEAAIRTDVNFYHDMFTRDLARFRRTTQGRVDRDFGRGRTMPAARAKANGLVDGVKSLADVLSELGVGGERRAQGRAVSRQTQAKKDADRLWNHRHAAAQALADRARAWRILHEND